MSVMPITTVLFDADGVLQFAHHDWVTALDEVGGTGFADAVFRHEEPAMRGEATMVACLERAVEEHDGAQGVDVAELLDLWRRFDIDPDAVAVVRDVRAAGLAAWLATNQQDVRRDTMRQRYAQVFDAEFYSCELGFTKSSPQYFHHVLNARGLAPEQVLFVDDSPGNVEVARGVGVISVQHDPSSGATRLREELAEALGRAV